MPAIDVHGSDEQLNGGVHVAIDVGDEFFALSGVSWARVGVVTAATRQQSSSFLMRAKYKKAVHSFSF